MTGPARRRPAGFTLAEVLLAILLLSISAFGYIALHERLIYSGWRLEERQVPREEARQALTGLVLSVRQGTDVGAPDVPNVAPGLKHLKAASQPRKVRNETVRYEVDTYEARRVPGW